MRSITASIMIAMSVTASALADLMLDPRIGLPDQAQINAVCSERDWRNPLIAVDSQSRYRLRSLSNRIPTSVADLRLALAKLPISDWPYGRVVAVPRQEEIPTELEVAQHLPISKAIIPLKVGWWVWPHDRYCVKSGRR